MFKRAEYLINKTGLWSNGDLSRIIDMYQLRICDTYGMLLMKQGPSKGKDNLSLKQPSLKCSVPS